MPSSVLSTVAHVWPHLWLAGVILLPLLLIVGMAGIFALVDGLTSGEHRGRASVRTYGLTTRAPGGVHRG